MDRAIQLVARDGPDALTFRAVAREANIAVGAFSRYFKTLGELEDAIAAKVIAKVGALEAAGPQGLREQLLRLCMDWLQITRTHPALGTFHGPASATALAGHVGQVVKVLAEAGVDFERAMMTYGMVINLAYSWGVHLSRPASRKIQKQSIQAFTRHAGEIPSGIGKLLTESATTDVYRRSFILLIDGLLPAHAFTAKKR